MSASHLVLPLTQLERHTHILLRACPCSQHTDGLRPAHLGTASSSDHARAREGRQGLVTV